MTVATPAHHALDMQIFQRVLVGVDGSDAGGEAAVQAGRLVAPLRSNPQWPRGISLSVPSRSGG